MTRNRDTDYNNNNINNNNDNNHYNKFERKISKLFDDFLNTHGSKFRGDVSKNSNWSPAIDIKEVDREYLVIADVPGVRKDDIDIELHDSVLVLTGHLNQDLFSTPQAQEINIGNRQQYPQHQQYQQQPPQGFQQSTEPPRQHQQPLQEPQPYQQTTEPQKYHQQPTEAQQYQQAVDQKYNLTNEPQQQSNHPPQQNLNNPQYQQQSNNPNYQQQSNNPQYQQQSNDPNHQQQSNDPNHQQKSHDPNHQQQSNEYQHIKNRRHQDSSRGERFHIQERPYGHFSRSIQLPSNIKSDEEFYATLENGVLKISIPKNNDKPRRKITIK